MSAETLPTTGRVALAAKVQASGFIVALSRGSLAWDGAWAGPNPPAPPIHAETVLDRFAWCRPTIVDHVREDPAGQIVAPNGARYATGVNETTRYVRIRLSIPVGEFAGQTLREIGVFIDPILAPGVPGGQIVLDAADVINPGRLFQLHWRPPLLIEDGDHFARNLIVRL